MGSYRTVNSVVRALGLLEILNRQNHTSIDVLHQVSGLPKPTIVRFMQTLETAGYVTKTAAGKGYSITSAVTSLSSGYQGAPMVVEAARPWAQDLTLTTKWPVAIATMDENAMMVSYSTSAESPMSPYQGILHRRMGLLSKAMGQAYLAFCPREERKLILSMLASKPHPDSKLGYTSTHIENLVDTVRRQGYAARTTGQSTTPSSSLALCIYDPDGMRVLGTMTLTWYRSAVSIEQALERYLPKLRSACEGVTENVAALQRRAG